MSPFKPLLLLFVCLSVHHYIHAQNIDREGYYIDLKGDTIPGAFPRYADNETNPSQVRFQPSSGQAILLSPVNCRKFAVKDYETYISYTGNRMLNATSYLAADIDTADRFEKVSIFLRERFNGGPYRLYQLHDSKRNNFYLSVDNGPLDELIYKEYGSEDSLKASDVYKRQLFALLGSSNQGDQRQVATYIEKMRFEASDMVTVLTLLSGKKPQHKRLEFRPQFFIGGGFSNNMFKVSGDPANSNYEIGTYGSQTTPIFEAGAKLYSQRHGGKLFFMGRIAYYKYSNTRFFDEVYWNYTTTHKANVVSIPLSIGYRLVPGNVISLEPSIGFRALLLSNSSDTQVPSRGPTVVDNGSGESMIFSPFVEFAITIKKRVSIVADYNFPVNTQSKLSYTSDHSSFSYGVRFFIF